MTSLDSTIYAEVKFRPCIVNNQKALFHKWTVDNVSQKTLGIVELENGRIAMAYPYEIIFCDNLISQYAFPEQQEEE